MRPGIGPHTLSDAFQTCQSSSLAEITRGERVMPWTHEQLKNKARQPESVGVRCATVANATPLSSADVYSGEPSSQR